MELKEILEEISLPARSNKHGFKDTSKLEKIEEILKREESPFYLVKKSDHAWIFGKKAPVMDEKSLLISTHADIVSEIKKPFSEYDENTKYFKGTYDNMGTNGACVDLMLNSDLPDNIFFAFTAEEESGRFTGAEYSYAYMKNRTGCDPDVIVLDVTYEGYDDDKLFSLEGLTAPTEEERKALLEKALKTDGDHSAFTVIKMKKKDDNSFLPKEYYSDETTDCDESYYYKKQNCLSFSFDLPTDGSMHSDSGLYVKEAVFKGYVESLKAMCYSLTNTYTEEIEKISAHKDGLILKAKDTPFRKTTYSYFGSGYYSGSDNILSLYKPAKYFEDIDQIPGQMNIYDYIDKDEDEEEYEEDWYDSFINTAYENAEMYYPDDMDTYLSDLAYVAGFDEGLPEELNVVAQDIFISVWENINEENMLNTDDYE